MFKQIIEQDLKKVVESLGFPTPDTFLSIPKKSEFGDYTTNIALQLSKQNSQKSKHSSFDIANEIINKLGHPSYMERIEIAGGGFINIFLKDELLAKKLFAGNEKKNPGRSKKVLVEFGHVNPLKEIHLGHLRTFILGESLSRILELQGKEVFRANYQGDIGLHIAKAIWGIQKLGLPSKKLKLEEKAKFLGQAYAEGNKEYEADLNIKREIDSINTALYQKDPKYQEIYKLAREWSLAYFEPVYEKLGVTYDRCFFESEVNEVGKAIVLSNVGKVFKEDEGAVIFPGEKYGLHTRVFVTSKGNPTYEGKEVGLAKAEYETFPYDLSVHVVGSEQAGYFEVLFKAIELIFPELKGKKYHLSYGMVDIKEGKMSSRTGEVITVDDLFSIVREKIREVMSEHKIATDQETVEKIAVGAIKFAYLKFAPNTNVIFNLQESVSIQGDSGPYIQYAYARIQSLLTNSKQEIRSVKVPEKIEEEERELLRWLEYFDLVTQQAERELRPNLICEYLLSLSKAFNLFYQRYPIIKSQNADFRLALTSRVGESLQIGLNLLGIDAPKRM